MDLNSSLLNKSNVDQLTKENVLEEYYHLQKLYKTQSTEVDTLRQENYSHKSSVTFLENMKIHIENENEQLQSENDILVDKVKKLQDQILTLTTQLESRNSETSDHQDEVIEHLKSELDKSQKCISAINAERDAFMNENEQLKDELEHVKREVHPTEPIDELKLIIEHQAEELNECHSKNTILNNELSELRRILDIKNQHVIDLNNLKESLQEEVATLRMELDLTKAASANSHSSKGNSLFGEVYDSRQQLQSNLRKLKKHYVDMNSKYSLKIAENKKLSNENLILTKQLQNSVESLSDVQYWWKGEHEQTIESLKENIKFLKNEIKSLKKISSVQLPVDDAWMVDNMNDLMKRHKQIVIETEEKLNKRIFGDFLTSERLHFLQRELHKWKSDAMKYECETNNLKLELDCLKTQSNMVSSSDPQELVELLTGIENKENLSPSSKNSLLGNSICEHDESIATKLDNSHVEENVDASVFKPEEKLEEEKENDKCKKDKNVYNTPSPPRVLKIRKKRFVKSVKPDGGD